MSNEKPIYTNRIERRLSTLKGCDPFGSLRCEIVNSELFFFSSRRRHTRWTGDWSSDVCSSDLTRCESALAEQDVARTFSDDRGWHPRSSSPERSPHNPPFRQGAFATRTAVHGIRRAVAGERSEERRVGKECRSGVVACA